mmetsp:Transcript_30394/g.47181  ORF Transcript_30394/g.47181 Transcript_30394/m.47181 type:complete len:180 (-) Transcript_30394:148-687(-)|eukprot:CAMPEP_0201520334 /NCGR_PEP_ID=MMETSP0161_2-20130828/10649_1 /ASSEMBLY_ACC=CAM_ASM_000251 /TAXON_ID=180227 /ORGANISM="Neoparamoeba aestuarina, Strain SoJaBio B1-5/56/2" /LENGTH=179 /DNA_ID=CAMNT_0047918655 /DNA_START=46 /DNA_END=585 /DNA_ORIENTATION=+
MGGSYYFPEWFGPPHTHRILLIGLDGGGKTVLLYKLRLPGGKVIKTLPTIGFNIEKITHNQIPLEVWDIGGQDKLRPIWPTYYRNIQGVIFVVDSAEKRRMLEAKEALQELVREEQLKDAVFLVLANKQDLSDALSAAEVTQQLGLEDIKHVKWKVKGTEHYEWEGLLEGLDWLVREIC